MSDKATKNLISKQEGKSVSKDLPKRYIVLYPKGDKVALALGIVLMLFSVSFFAWKMVDKLTQDWALQPVPASTPTPSLKSMNKS